MKNKDPNLDVQPEDWERQASEPTDLEGEDRIKIARADERIKNIQAQLLQHNDRMTRIESNLNSVSTGLITAIQEQLKPYENKLDRIDDSWKSSVKWWITFTLIIITIIIGIFGLT